MSFTNPRAILYHYNPSLPGSITLASLFALVTSYLLIQLLHFRACFGLPLVIGGILEVAAYVSRALSHNHTQSPGPFIIASIFTLVAPALFANTIYMILGRIVRLLDAGHLSPVRVTLLTKIFVLGDIFSFAVQSVGAQMQTGKDADKQKFGQKLITGALFLQMFIFWVVHCCRWCISLEDRQEADGHCSLCTVAEAYGDALCRQWIDFVEKSCENYRKYPRLGFVHEAFLYGFDAMPIFAVLVIMAVIYAPAFLRSRKGTAEEAELQRLESGKGTTRE